MSAQMELSNQILSLEKDIKYAEELKRLNFNKDFKSLIQTQYLQEKPLELVKELSKYNSTDARYQEIVTELYSISCFHKFLTTTITTGQCAEADLIEAKAIPHSELI